MTLFLATSLLASSAWAASLSVVPGPKGETITLEVDEAKPNKVFTLDNPDRLVVDIPNVEDASGIALPSAYRGDLIKKVRTGRFNATTTRVVFDLASTIQVGRTKASSDELIIEISGKSGKSGDDDAVSGLLSSIEPPRTQGAKPGKDQIDIPPPASEKPVKKEETKSEKSKSDKKEAKKEDVKKEEAKKTEKKEDKKEEKPAKENESTPAPQPFNPPKASSKPAAEKSDEKPMIVIDPGHGGVDPGASGAKGSIEKDIVLDYALALKAKLLKSGRYRVALTRQNDEFIVLRERVEIARRQGAAMFISLHADSAPGSARGLSVYTVSEKASDEEAKALAARENKVDVLAGMNLATEREDVADILISLAERDTKNRSATLADLLVNSMTGSVKLLPEPHRFAGFAVLKAPDIPSVLVELGFLSHPQEEKLINSGAHRDKVITGITRGIDSYFQKEKTLWTR